MNEFFTAYWAPILFIVIMFAAAFYLQNRARNSGSPQNRGKVDRKRAEVKKQAKPEILSSGSAENLLKKAEINGDRRLLFRIWRETNDDKIRFAVYEKLIRSEKQVRFGGMEWIVLDQVEDRQLLLRKYALDGFRYGDGNNKQINYEGEGCYYTFNCTWGISLIRYYLNSEFYANFSAEEQSRIIRVNADPVFVLSCDEYGKYSKTGIAVRAAFTENKACVTCWSRDQAGEEVHHGEWKPCFGTFIPMKDLDKIPSADILSFEGGLGRAEFDRVLSIRPAVWVRLS